MVRVAALEVSASTDIEQSLAQCLQLLERSAREHGAELVVCPELALAVMPDDREGCAAIARLGEAMAQRARELSISIACSFGRAGACEPHLFCPSGELAANLSPGLFETVHGLVAVCSGSDLLNSQTVRELARSGAVLICSSGGEVDACQLLLHLTARAVESHVFVASAGHRPADPLPSDLETLPPELPPDGAAPPRTPIAQIVGPSAEHQATASEGEFAVAELDLTLALQKERPDGTHLAALHRPELYRGVHTRRRPLGTVSWGDELAVAALDVPHLGSFEEVLLDTRVYLEALCERGVQLVVLPELFCFGPDLPSDPESCAEGFINIVRELAGGCRRSGMHVVTSLVERVGSSLFHTGVLIGQSGVVMRQPQLHVPERHHWAQPGSRIESAPMPWGRLAIAVGEDALIPELGGAFEALGVKLVSAPLSPFTAIDAGLSLAAQADERGFAVVASVPLARSPEQTRFGSHLVVDPNAWPARRALPEQRVLHGTLRLSQLAMPDRDSVVRGPSALTSSNLAPEPALN